MIAACHMIDWLYILAAAKELGTKSVLKTIKAKEVVLETVVFDEVDKYIEMVRLEWDIAAA